MNGISALIKETPERALTPSMGGHSEKTQSMNQKAGPYHTNPARAWALGFQPPEQ